MLVIPQLSVEVPTTSPAFTVTLPEASKETVILAGLTTGGKLSTTFGIV